MSNKIIQFNPKERLLSRIDDYVESPERFLEDPDTAVPSLLKAMRYADHERKQQIIILLGSIAKSEVAWPFYRIVADPEENEEIRYIASIQLRLVLPSLTKEDREPLLDRLLKDLEEEDSEMRLYAASALGWKGNFRAAIPLISLLYDSDLDVMQAAVNSLTDLGDDRILNVLLERLENGPVEQKRCILFNLWHLASKQDEVIGIYEEYLRHENPDLRYDALVLLRAVTRPGQCMNAYITCLRDEDARIRLLALERIGESEINKLFGYKKKIMSMVMDPDIEVQAVARKIMNML